MKNFKVPELDSEKVFNFHKSGNDKEYDEALSKMDGVYENIFGSATDYDAIF